MSLTKADSRETAQRVTQRYRNRREQPSTVWGIPYGIRALDGMTGGIQTDPNNDYAYLFSRPGVGKTSLAAEITKNVATGFRDTRSGNVVRCVLLEGGRDVFQTRMACMMADVPHRALKTGRATDEQFEKFYRAQIQLHSLPIEYLDAEDDDVTLSTIDSFIRQGDTGWWMLDHIGMIPGARQGASQLSEISKELRKMCKATAPALILTHQNRTTSGPDKEKDARPTMENLSGADFIVKDADVLLGLYRPDKDKSTGTAQSTATSSIKKGELIVLKSREGEEGTIHMAYHSWYTRWEETDPLNSYWLSLLER